MKTEKSLENVCAKMREYEIRNFSDKEQDRVFSNTVSPKACKRGLQRMIQEGLTIHSLYVDGGDEIGR